jgi:hypothetical protein
LSLITSDDCVLVSLKPDLPCHRMIFLLRYLHHCLFWSALAASSHSEDFILKPGEFPPAGTSRAIAGELIDLDHVNRTGTLRPDRTDAQRRGDWDLPLRFASLPYGSMYYHGAPATLKDVPIGTHLHGEFYAGDLPVTKERRADDAKYNRAIRLEDDFSFCQRTQRAWRVDAIALDVGTLTVTGVTGGKADAKPTVFQVGPSTRVWKGRGIGTLQDLQLGHSVLLNLTVCTLKGPGRVTHLWLDEESRALATAHQLEVHRQFMREHGLPGIIDEVDNEKGIVTVTLFDGFDPKLLEEFASNAAITAAANAPPFVPGPGLVDPISVTAAVAEDNLRTWDQINDRKSGPMLQLLSAPSGPGQSGWRIRFQPSLLVEGFRPKRIIRVWPAKWKVDDLPREEKMYQ